MSDSPLRELSNLVGILPEYYDIWGNRHEASDASRLAILSAMAIPATGDADIQTDIHAWQQRHWHQALPAVQVDKVDQPLRVTLCLPEAALPHAHHWRISLEHGAVHEAHFLPQDLERLDAIHLDGEDRVALALQLPALGALGYHRLEIAREGNPLGEMALILCPSTCFQSPSVRGEGRIWGITTQLYGLRSERNWGLGDYGDLRRLIEWAAQAGAGMVGVNPLHALFPHNPRHCSPYSPSSRRYFNVLHVSVEAIPELAECEEAKAALAAPEFQARLRALRATPLVDYAEVGQAKYGVLEILYRHFRAHHRDADTPRGQAFRDFQARGGHNLYLFALYHALQAHFHHQDWALWGWPVWPQAYQEPGSPEVRAFAEAHLERIEWIIWLQWLADEQLAAVGRRSFELGLGIGLYQDLAVGVDKGGAETWMHRDLYALDAKVGCPPDEFNPLGQDWGLPPWLPQRLREAGYAPFIAMLQANMKYAGALRIDHVMGLMRLYWVPPGLSGKDGAYVKYPIDDLLGILALESQRNQCLVIGEDLGTVPEEVRIALHDLGVLSYKLFYFERDPEGGFKAPSDYPAQSLVAATTHDLPTLSGFWKGIDIALRTDLNLFPSEELRASQVAGRSDDRVHLLLALKEEGLLPESIGVDPANVPEMTPALVCAIHRYLARTPCKIALVQCEDMLCELEQANLPGTTDEHPNWRRKLSLNLEEWTANPEIRALAKAMTEERRAPYIANQAK